MAWINFKNMTAFSLMLLCSTSLFAKQISMYDEPKADAKVIGTLNLSSGVIPIFKPENSEWTKVGDPKNGNVGWVRNADLESKDNSNITFTQHLISDNQGQNAYQMLQFGQPKKLTPEEQEALMKRLKEQQQNMQKSLQDIAEKLSGQHIDFVTQPVIVPLVVMPKPPTAPNGTPSTVKPATATPPSPPTATPIQPGTTPSAPPPQPQKPSDPAIKH